MGEVIQFPVSDNLDAPVTSKEQVKENIQDVQLFHISETLDSILPMLFGRLEMAGFDLAKGEDIKNGALLVESLKSVLCKYYGIEHPFQEVAENVFSADETGDLSLNKSIHVDFKKVDEL
jgi:hypothetical protein